MFLMGGWSLVTGSALYKVWMIRCGKEDSFLVWVCLALKQQLLSDIA